MGDHRETMGVLPQHLTPPAIFAAVCCPHVVTGRFPATLAGLHPVGLPGDTHPALQFGGPASYGCCEHRLLRLASSRGRPSKLLTRRRQKPNDHHTISDEPWIVMRCKRRRSPW